MNDKVLGRKENVISIDCVCGRVWNWEGSVWGGGGGGEGAEGEAQGDK